MKMNTRQSILNLVYHSLEDGLVTPEEVLRVTDSFIAERNARGGTQNTFAPPGGANPLAKRRKLNPGGSSDGPGTRYVGRLQNYSQKNGYGFLACDDTKAKYNADVFLHKAQYNELQVQSGGYIQIGAMVEFSVEEKEGKPQARQVTFLGSGAPPQHETYTY